MRLFFILYGLISFTYCVASEDDRLPPSSPSDIPSHSVLAETPHKKIVIPIENEAEITVEPGLSTLPINLSPPIPLENAEEGTVSLHLENVEDVQNADCSINCMKASRSFWTVSTGLFGFLGGIGTPAKSALVALSTLGNYSEDVKKWLGITTTVVSSGTFICNKLADFGYKRAINLQKELKETEEQIKHILEKYEIENTTGILPIKLKKTDKNKLSSMDKNDLKKLQNKYDDLTQLSNVEKKYFSLSNCCLKNIYSSAQVIDTLLNIANFVMVPLTTIPTWDAGTATTLSITLICIEGGCIFFNQLARQSILINQNSLKLRHDLEKEEV